MIDYLDDKNYNKIHINILESAFSIILTLENKITDEYKKSYEDIIKAIADKDYFKLIKIEYDIYHNYEIDKLYGLFQYLKKYVDDYYIKYVLLGALQDIYDIITNELICKTFDNVEDMKEIFKSDYYNKCDKKIFENKEVKEAIINLMNVYLKTDRVYDEYLTSEEKYKVIFMIFMVYYDIKKNNIYNNDSLINTLIIQKYHIERFNESNNYKNIIEKIKELYKKFKNEEYKIIYNLLK